MLLGIKRIEPLRTQAKAGEGGSVSCRFSKGYGSRALFSQSRALECQIKRNGRIDPDSVLISR